MSRRREPEHRPGHYDRERSPRGERRDPYREDRSRDDRRRQPGGRREHDSRYGSNQSRGGGNNSGRGGMAYRDDRAQESEEALPNIPANVPVPQNGRLLDLKPIQRCRSDQGKQCQVYTNHFRIQSLPPNNTTIYQWDVRMMIPENSQRRGSPEVSPAQKRKAWVVLDDSGALGDSWVTDSVSTIWSTNKLLGEDVQEDQLLLSMPGHRDDRPNQVQMSVRADGMINIKMLVEYISAGESGLATQSRRLNNTFKWLNSVFKDGPSRKFMTFSRGTSFFIRGPGLVQVLNSSGGLLEAIRGIHQSVFVGFNCLSLCIDVKAAAFWVPDLPMMQIYKSAGESLMLGLYFVVRHLGSEKNKIKKRVQRLDLAGANKTTFEWRDPGTNIPMEITVEQYFQQKYKIRLEYPALPLLVCKDGAFPMELCYTAPNERYREPLQGKETADFIKFATSPAFVRQKQIMGNVARLETWTDKKLQQHGLSVSTQMLQLPAIVLAPPNVEFHKDIVNRSDLERGSWNLRGKRFIRPGRFQSWGVMCFRGQRGAPSEQELEQLARKLNDGCTGHGMNGSSRRPVIQHGSLQRPVDETVGDFIRAIVNEFKCDKPDLLVFILQADMPTSIYKQLKQCSEVVHGIPSQVLLADKSMGRSGGSPQYISNVALKVCAKLGGLNWEVALPRRFSKEVVLILGADVSHPSPSELRSKTPPPSYATMVSSMDRNCCTYSAVSVTQLATQELIESDVVVSMFKELQRRWNDKKNPAPTMVVYLRDGVSDSQVEPLLSTEVEGLKKARSQLGLDFKLTVVNTLKRHHTRFFPVDRNMADKLGNVLPGTCIENSVKNNDVFLVSQAALQGTCRPIHYVSLYDESKLDISDFENLMLHGCYSYQRATRSVGLHAAVYYADQCCERAKMHVRADNNGRLVMKDVHQDLRNTMYWQ